MAFFAHAANLTGASRSMIDLSSALKKKGVVPVVFLPEHGMIEEELKKCGTRYYVLPYQPWTHGTQMKRSLAKRAKHALKVIINTALLPKAAGILREEKIDIIHSNSLSFGFGAELAAYLKLPHVWHMREFMEEDQHITFYDEKKSLRYLNQAAEVIAISDVIAEKFSRKIGREVRTVYNGVPIAKYLRESKTLFGGERTELLISGRIIDTKGQLEAIQATELLREEFPTVHLRVIGDGTGSPYFDEIHRYVAEHALEEWVEFIPFQKDISPYTDQADIQLVCSHNEAFGRVTVEGMLSHSLVIGADAGCTPYLIANGQTGLLYRCGDGADLAKVVAGALRDRAKAQAMADEGCRYAQETFSIEHTAAGVYGIYSDILSLQS